MNLLSIKIDAQPSHVYIEEYTIIIPNFDLNHACCVQIKNISVQINFQIIRLT